MSGKDLVEKVANAAWHSGSGVDPRTILRVICEELGITQEVVDGLHRHAWAQDEPRRGVLGNAADILQSLLDAREATP